MHKINRWDTFVASIFFVLGFSLIFSILGIILQTFLSGSAFIVQKWLGRIGGLLIILFGLYVAGIISIGFLERERKLKINTKRFKSKYLVSFLFGAAFAIGWTPCIGAILGAILTLAATQPQMAFLLLLAYSLGLGIPFLLVGLFTTEAQSLIIKSEPVIKYLKVVFGIILIFVGILIYTSQLARLADFAYTVEFLRDLDLLFITGSTVNLGIAFLAGLVSFLSPCVLPLIPAFLAYLAAFNVNNHGN